eukprot:scaffold80361_cov72-Phaeocystis_antarctica.AAC.2
MVRPCGLKSRSCGAVAAAIASSIAGADKPAATAPQLRDFKPQGLAITAWAFAATNRALDGGDGVVVIDRSPDHCCPVLPS